MRSTAILVGLSCCLAVMSSAAEAQAPVPYRLFERATRPASMRGLDEAVEARLERSRTDPGGLRRSRVDLEQPATPPPSRPWAVRHSTLVGMAAGASVGAVAALAGDNRLFCPGGDESCVLHSPGLKIVGVGIFAALGGLAGYLIGLGQ